MKHRPPVTLVLLLLVAGAIVNVAVAWGLARFTSRFSVERIPFGSYVSSTQQAWRVGRSEGVGASQMLAIPFPVGRAASNTPVWADDRLYTGWSRWPRALDDCALTVQIVQATGWPALAMTASGDNVAWKRAIEVPGQRSITMMNGLTTSIQVTRALPVDVFWPGFAINTIFYAAVLWLLFAAIVALRSRRRIKRRLCPKCAYPVGTSDVCTECGAAVTPPPKAATA